MIEEQEITWIILAGGQARRMHGRDKGLVHFQGRPLIEHCLFQLQPQLSSPLLINANRNIDDYQQYATVIQDIWKDYPGPLAGIHAGLTYATTPWVGFSPCDCPFVHSELVQRFRSHDKGNDCQYSCEALVATDGHRPQPAFLMLNRNVMPRLESYLSSGERRLMGFIKQLHYHSVLLDDEPHAFTNINAPEDLQAYT